MDNVQQQIVEKLTGANNILVTVSANPTVDQLAACIGLTLLLNKMNKHATAVFSGKVPSTIEFLKPEETIETNTDSLRDFIISLDKAKADKLRYKVEDEVVKIFITPYKSSISEKDLVFSQGDFNVDVVMALGVHEAQDLDNAITAHGRILHDAVVICVNTTANGGQLGGINWVDATASGLSELMTILSTHLGQNVLDEQIATALLTGIVAQTEHFSNQKTTPSTMTSSATLLTAGANQQLVSKELATASAPKPVAAAAAPAPKDGSNGELDVPHEASEKSPKKAAKKTEEKPAAEKPAAKPEAPKALAAVAAPEAEAPSVDPDEKLTQRIKRIEPLPHDAPAPAAVITPSIPAGPAEPAQPITKPILDDTSDDSLDAILKQQEAEAPKPAPESPAVVLPEPNPGPSAPIIEVPPAPEQIALPAPEAKPQASEPIVPGEPEKTEITLPGPDVTPAEVTPGETPSASAPVEAMSPLGEPAVTGGAPASAEPAVPSGPEADNGQTLRDIEESVHSPHAETLETSDVDSARKAVEDALKQAPDQTLEPLESVGAVNVDLNLGHEAADAPPVPETQPGPGMPAAAAPGAELPAYLQTPVFTPAPNGTAAGANMPPFEDLASTPPPFGLQTPPPQAVSPTGSALPPQGPPPPPVPPPMP